MSLSKVSSLWLLNCVCGGVCVYVQDDSPLINWLTHEIYKKILFLLTLPSCGCFLDSHLGALVGEALIKLETFRLFRIGRGSGDCLGHLVHIKRHSGGGDFSKDKSDCFGILSWVNTTEERMYVLVRGMEFFVFSLSSCLECFCFQGFSSGANDIRSLLEVKEGCTCPPMIALSNIIPGWGEQRPGPKLVRDRLWQEALWSLWEGFSHLIY